jgi:hypothetical protein
LLLQQLGSCGKSYRREAKAAGRRIISEMYSPPRVTAELQRMKHKHLLPGFALDLTVVDPEDGLPWDFSKSGKREKARQMRRRQKPYLLIGSPECTAFSTWQYLNEARSINPQAFKEARRRAKAHIKFMAELYREQLDDGHYFLHEHPRYATSWQLEVMQDLMDVPGVQLAHGDQCQYGAEVQRGPLKGSPVMKPSGFLTNSPAMFQAMSRRCTGSNKQCSRPGG